MSQNKYNIFAKAPIDPKIREFVKSEKFQNFYKTKSRYINDILKIQKLKDINEKEIKFFIKVNVVLDNVLAIETLVKNRLCDVKDDCEFLKKQAHEFKSERILNLINRLCI